MGGWGNVETTSARTPRKALVTEGTEECRKTRKLKGASGSVERAWMLGLPGSRGEALPGPTGTLRAMREATFHTCGHGEHHLGLRLCEAQMKIESVGFLANHIRAYADVLEPLPPRPGYGCLHQLLTQAKASFGLSDYQPANLREGWGLDPEGHKGMEPPDHPAILFCDEDKVIIALQDRGKAVHEVLFGGWIPKLPGEFGQCSCISAFGGSDEHRGHGGRSLSREASQPRLHRGAERS